MSNDFSDPSREQIALVAIWMYEHDWDFSEIEEMIRRPWKYADEARKAGAFEFKG